MSNELKQQVIEAVEAHQEELLQLCSYLIKIPSENPPGNTTPITKFIDKYLTGYGLETSWHEAEKDRWNLLSRFGSTSGKKLIFCGHTDVVPAGDLSRWDFPPFCGEIRDGWLLGRGASDMKAGLGGILFAAAMLKRLNIPLQGELCLAIVPDEETGGEFGVPWLLERQLISGYGCLIAEPSSPLHPTLGQKGSCWFKLTVFGEQAHGSLGPIAGKNAIADAILAIEKIKKVWDMEIKIPKEIQPIIDVSKKYMLENEREEYINILEKISINVGTIKGGTKSNVVPDTCEVEIDCRLPFGITKQEVIAFIHGELAPLKINYQLDEFGFRSNANYTPPEDPVCRAVVDNISFVTGSDAYGVMQWASSDARHFRNHNIPVLQYGPAYLPSIHNFNEKVKTEDIIRCAKVYAAAAVDFLNT